ncbi:MAG: LLM class flavin-dependent oxidoreductase [archaeon]|nr:MAG: LLM class flavin-dependent oxidoreductase [archaeon]
MLSIKNCGIMLEPQMGMTMLEVVSTARLVERLGFGYLFRSDHLLPTDNRRGVDSPECWTSLGALAASTTDLRFGPMVTPIGFRNPALLARMACTLHSFSGGRLQLAVGAGWYESEYRAHGYPFPPFKERMSQFDEAFSVISSLVREGRADFDGSYFSAHTDCLPRPDGKVNVIIGGRSKPLAAMAARRADEWNVFLSPPETYSLLKATFDSALDGRSVVVSETGPFMLGRDPGQLESFARMQASWLKSEASPQETLSRLKARDAPVGSPEEFLEKVGRKVDAGIERFYFQLLAPENTAMLELLAETLKGGV